MRGSSHYYTSWSEVLVCYTRMRTKNHRVAYSRGPVTELNQNGERVGALSLHVTVEAV